jgi:hypothetical protein
MGKSARLPVTMAASMLATVALSVWNAAAFAAAQQLNCVLTDTQQKPGSEKRAIVVTFDESAKTLTAKDGDNTYTFTKVSMSAVAMSGSADKIGIGIDRSALGIVWQQYDADTPNTPHNEYGRCTP